MRETAKQLWGNFREFLSAPIPDFISNYDPEIVDADREVRRFGYVTILVVFLGFGGWAMFAPLESAAIGLGTVQVEGNKKAVQHLEGGIVSEIFVENGDYVTVGQALVQLDTTESSAEKRIIEGRLWARQATVSRLLAERDDLQKVEFLPELLEIDDRRAMTAMDSESALFEARKADRLGEVSVIQQRIAQLNEQITGKRSVLATKENIAESLKIEVQDLNSLLEDGYVDKQRIRQLERSLAQALGEISELRASISSAEVQIQEGRLQILQLGKRFITNVVDELTRAQDELYDQERRLEIISDRVARSTIRAPTSGYVLALQPNTAGAVIGAGQEIMAVVPDVDHLLVKAKMSPMDIDRISLGQEAEVRFSVFKDAYTITGTLVSVSADSLTDEATGQDYFEAKVELAQEDLELLGEYQLVPGMPAEVLVKTGNRTLIGYLTSPLQRMFDNALLED